LLTDCGKQHFWEVETEIMSPHYPDNYESDLKCLYYIHNPLNSMLMITFQSFAVEYHADCDYDYLKVGSKVHFKP